MKGYYKLFALALCVGGMSQGFSAEGKPTDCVVSPNEQMFMSQLSEKNQEAFCHMNEAQRMACMEMAQTTDNYGNQLTPDQAVESMANSTPAGA